MADFAGKRALVTGAASGIGLAVARQLAAGGARLIAVDRAGPPANAPDALWHRADVTDEAFWETLDLSGLDLAVVNAGIATSGRIADTSLAEWRRTLAINLDGAFLTLRAAMRAMDGRPGAIVLTASASGLKAEPGVGAYAASKAALLQLMRVAAKEGAAQGLRVNAVAPGGVATPIWRGVAMFDEMAARDGEEAAFAAMGAVATPLGRFAAADEIAGQIAFLLSDATASVTGATLVADGGYTL